MISLLLSLLTLYAWTDQSVPTSPTPTPVVKGWTFPEIKLRYFRSDKSNTDLKYMGMLASSQTFGKFIQTEAMAGLKYRVHPKIKIGTHYKITYNERRNDQWVKDDTENVWKWHYDENAKHGIYLETLYRHLLTDSLRAEMRLQYQATLERSLSSINIRPSLVYFDLNPRGNINTYYLMYEYHHGLEESGHQHWLYSGFTLPLSPKWRWGGSISRGYWQWLPNETVKERSPTTNYNVEEWATRIGLNLSFHH